METNALHLHKMKQLIFLLKLSTVEPTKQMMVCNQWAKKMIIDGQGADAFLVVAQTDEDE